MARYRGSAVLIAANKARRLTNAPRLIHAEEERESLASCKSRDQTRACNIADNRGA